MDMINGEANQDMATLPTWTWTNWTVLEIIQYTLGPGANEGVKT